MERLATAAAAAASALRNPLRADMVALLGDATGEATLRRMRQRMLEDAVGRRLLRERPRLRSVALAPAALRVLPDGSLGRAYLGFMEHYGFSADGRPAVREDMLADGELAWVMARYREGHDFTHVLTGLPPTLAGELALKVVEAVQTGLPVAQLSALAGPLRLKRPGRWLREAPAIYAWAASCGRQAKPATCLDIERRLAEPLSSCRGRWGYTYPPPRALREIV